MSSDSGKQVSIAFPAHLGTMYIQTVSAHLRNLKDVELVTKSGKAYQVKNHQGKWTVWAYKDLPPRCVRAVRAFVQKMDGRFVQFARVGEKPNDVENIEGHFSPRLFDAKPADPDNELIGSGIWYVAKYPGLGL